MVYTDWQTDNFYHALQLHLRDVTGKIAIEKDHVTMDVYKNIARALPESEKVDISGPAANIR